MAEILEKLSDDLSPDLVGDIRPYAIQRLREFLEVREDEFNKFVLEDLDGERDA